MTTPNVLWENDHYIVITAFVPVFGTDQELSGYGVVNKITGVQEDGHTSLPQAIYSAMQASRFMRDLTTRDGYGEPVAGEDVLEVDGIEFFN
jgi:hypothetical protein